MSFVLIFVPAVVATFLFEKSIKSIFVKYIFENELVKYLDYDKQTDIISFQKTRYEKSCKILVFLIALPVLKFNLYFLFLVLVLTFITYKKPYWTYKKKYKASVSLVKYQFPIWLRQIQILLHNNNVINSLAYSQTLAPSIIKDDLNRLIKALKLSPNDVNVFVEFMDYFNISEINRAMKLLYRTYIVDKDESSKQLSRMIVSTTKWIRQERLERQKDNLVYFEWIGIIPLFGVTLVFLVIMASLITNLFGKGVGM